MNRQMLMSVICCQKASIIGRERLFIVLQWHSKALRLIMATSTRLFLFYLFYVLFINE